MKRIFFALMFLVLLACKNDTSQNQSNSEVKNQKNELVVSINFTTNKQDEFKLMLNGIIKDEFQRKNIHIIEKVAPSSSTDNITANFGPNNMSNFFSINLGNKQEKEIKFQSISLNYKNNAINVSSKELSDYFKFNEYVTQDSITNVVRTTTVKNKHLPTIYLKRKFINQLKK